MTDQPYECTPTTFVLHVPVDALEVTEQRALRRWAFEHDLKVASLAVGRPIERDETLRSLRWREVEDDGSVVAHLRLPPFGPGDEPWPRPFPDVLLRDDTGCASTA